MRAFEMFRSGSEPEGCIQADVLEKALVGPGLLREIEKKRKDCAKARAGMQLRRWRWCGSRRAAWSQR